MFSLNVIVIELAKKKEVATISTYYYVLEKMIREYSL